MTVTMLLPRTDAVRSMRLGLLRQQLTATRWRVTTRDGSVVGYLDSASTEGRVRAMRMRRDRRGFIPVGDFGGFEEAFEALAF